MMALDLSDLSLGSVTRELANRSEVFVNLCCQPDYISPTPTHAPPTNLSVYTGEGWWVGSGQCVCMLL